MWRLYSFNWCRSWSRIKQSQFTKSFAWKNRSLCLSVNFNIEFTLMKDKEWTGIVILLHQIFPFLYFTHLEFFEQCFLKLSVFDETGKSKVGLETFQNEGFIGGSLFLIDDRKILVDLTVITLHFYGTEFSGFSFTLFK